MSTIEERVKKVVAEQLGVKEDEVSLSASFVDDLGADSLDTVELVMELQELEYMLKKLNEFISANDIFALTI